MELQHDPASDATLLAGQSEQEEVLGAVLVLQLSGLLLSQDNDFPGMRGERFNHTDKPGESRLEQRLFSVRLRDLRQRTFTLARSTPGPRLIFRSAGAESLRS